MKEIKKRERFTRDDIRLARFAKALAHPARIMILKQLKASVRCSFSDLSESLPLAPSTVSQHLAELKTAGLVKADPVLPRIDYMLDHERWKQERKLFKEFLKTKSPALD